MKKLISYLPSVVFAVVEVFIVLAVISDAGYSSDADIMAGLVLLYATIRSIGIGIGLTIDKLTLGLANDLNQIKERIRSDYDTEDEKETLKAASDKVAKTEVKLYIRSFGVFIIYLIALAELLG